MSSQGSLFAPGSANREEPIQARLLARNTDPVTSHQAAKRVVESGRLTEQQEFSLQAVKEDGPGTVHEIARRGALVHGIRTLTEKWETDWRYMLARRLPELERKLLVRVQQDPSKPCRCKPNAKRCRCRDVVRDGSRVWEMCSG